MYYASTTKHYDKMLHCNITRRSDIATEQERLHAVLRDLVLLTL